MLVREARAAAQRWVHAMCAHLPDRVGAYSAGSTNWLAGDADLPPGTDLDVMVLLEDDAPPPKLGKFLYQGALLEVTYLPAAKVQTAEHVLGDYHLAPSLATARVLYDPTGALTTLQADVARGYPQRAWVRRRGEQAYAKIERQQHALERAPTWPDQVIGWLFPTGVMAHVLLVAGLRNPTVRRRYVAVRELLEDSTRADYYPTLLAFLGCAEMKQAAVAAHLDALAHVFDATAPVVKSPFSFASDLDASARPIAIDGSRALIEQGNQREAIFWMVATYSRCMLALLHDAPALYEHYAPGYARLLGDLGIHTLTDLQARRDRTLAHLPTLWQVAEAIMAANRAITD